MVKCSVCASDLKSKEGITCSRQSCHHSYHKGCVGMGKNDPAPASWMCPKCVSQTRRGDDSNTTARSPASVKGDFVNTTARSRAAKTNEDETSENIESIIRTQIEIVFQRELPKLVASITESVSNSLKTKFSELELSVQTISNMYDTLKSTVDKSNITIKKLQTENKSLNDKIKTMQATMEEIERESLKRDQWSRLQNVELVGVPESVDESLSVLVEKVAKHIQDLFLSAARKTRSLSSSDIGMQGEKKNIYINEHLCIKNKQLLSQCKAKAKSNNYKFVWTKNCRIYTRKAENSPFILVSSLEDIKKMV
ncbi:hypothetical protein ACJJTC_009399 [Scirpophaga incertulas]